MNLHEKLFHIALSKARRSASGKGQKPGKAQPDELILIKPFDASESNYAFSFTDSEYEGIPIAKGLKFRNNFQISGMAIGILTVKNVNDKLMWGATNPQYHADPNIFNIAAGTANLSEAEALNGLYNGHLSLKTNEGIKIDKMPIRGFRTVQQTQRGGLTDGAAAFSTANMHTGLELKSPGGTIKVAGGNENELIVHINTLDKTHIAGGVRADGATYKNFLYIVARGAIIKGGTIAELQNN